MEDGTLYEDTASEIFSFMPEDEGGSGCYRLGRNLWLGSTTVEESKDSSFVYAVGSWNTMDHEDYFIVDRIYSHPSEAIRHCDSRSNPEFDWSVRKWPLGGHWLEGSVVHYCHADSAAS